MRVYEKNCKHRYEYINVDVEEPWIYDWKFLMSRYNFSLSKIVKLEENSCGSLINLDINLINYILKYQDIPYQVFFGMGGNLSFDYSDNVDFEILVRYCILNESFIRENKDKFNWTLLSSHQKLSEEFIEEFADRLDWDLLTLTQDFSDEFKDKHKDKINWEFVTIREKARLTGDEFQKLL